MQLLMLLNRLKRKGDSLEVCKWVSRLLIKSMRRLPNLVLHTQIQVQVCQVRSYLKVLKENWKEWHNLYNLVPPRHN